MEALEVEQWGREAAGGRIPAQYRPEILTEGHSDRRVGVEGLPDELAQAQCRDVRAAELLGQVEAEGVLESLVGQYGGVQEAGQCGLLGGVGLNFSANPVPDLVATGGHLSFPLR